MTQNKLQQERNLFYQVELGQVYPRKKSPPKNTSGTLFFGSFYPKLYAKHEIFVIFL